MRKVCFALIALLLAGALCACGGGGGGDAGLDNNKWDEMSWDQGTWG